MQTTVNTLQQGVVKEH